MPIIRIDFDDGMVSGDSVLAASQALRKIVSEETGIDDVPVYANAAHVKVHIAPVEVFVEMSASKIDDIETLFKKIKDRICSWRDQSGFQYRINLTLIPMNWKFETGI